MHACMYVCDLLWMNGRKYEIISEIRENKFLLKRHSAMSDKDKGNLALRFVVFLRKTRP